MIPSNKERLCVRPLFVPVFDREQRSERGPRSVLVVLLVVATLRIVTVKKLLMFTNVHKCPLMSTNVH